MAETKSKFEALNEQPQNSLLRETVIFIVENRQWWLVPIAFVLGLVAALAVLSATGAAPFIYTLF